MNKIAALAVVLLVSIPTCAQTQLSPVTARTDIGGHNSNAVAVDLTNSGTKELIFAGIGSTVLNYAGEENWDQKRMCRVMSHLTGSRWKILDVSYGLDYFSPNIGFNVGDRPSLSVCDINADGYMDLVAFETTGIWYDDEPYLDHISREGIFLGNGDGTFEQFEPTFIDENGDEVEFDMRFILSGDVADFNNDGLIDIVGIGYQSNNTAVATSYTDANVVLLNRGGGVFEVSYYLNGDYVTDYGQTQNLYHFECGFVIAYDLNNDGYTDFIIASNSNDRVALGVKDGSNTHFTDIFLNDPDNPGQFRRQYVTESTLPSMSDGGLTIADFNNDGVPDIFFSGWTGNDRGTYVYGVYIGEVADDGSLSYTAVDNSTLSEMRGQNSTSRQYGAIDWDGDGNIDIFNLGWSSSLSTQTCFIAMGNGDATFSEDYRVGGGSEGCVAFIDWNCDGVNDFLTLSESKDDTFFSVSSLTDLLAVTLNPNEAPSTPDAPASLSVTAEGGTVNAEWEAAESSMPNVTYEYYVVDADGNIVAGGNSYIGGDDDGLRKVNMPGNAYNAKKITLTLPDGTYTMGVQTVDAAYQGSTFITATVEVSGSAVTAYEAMVKPEQEEYDGDTYANPVIDESVPDPTVIRGDDGYFYLYGTENIRNTPIFRSANLIEWDYITTAFTEDTRPTMVPDGNIWAPDINKIGDKYVLYFSKSEWGGEWTCGIGYATADAPEGPFDNATALFISSEIGVQNSIDPFYIEDDDGSKWLFWGSFSGIYAIELADDGLGLKDGAEKVQVAGTLTEGTYIIKHDGYYYFFGSAGSCCSGSSSTYHVVTARSESLLGPYVNKLGYAALDNYFSNLLYRSGDVVGPGHNSELVIDDVGDYWMFYHGYDASDTDAGRKVYLDKVLWDEDGWPYIENVIPSVEAPVPVIDTTVKVAQAITDTTESGVTVSPHRVHDKLTISTINNEAFTWQMYSVSGEKVKSGKGNGFETIDMYDVPMGLYIVNVNTGNGSTSEKVIKY